MDWNLVKARIESFRGFSSEDGCMVADGTINAAYNAVRLFINDNILPPNRVLSGVNCDIVLEWYIKALDIHADITIDDSLEACFFYTDHEGADIFLQEPIENIIKVLPYVMRIRDARR